MDGRRRPGGAVRRARRYGVLGLAIGVALWAPTGVASADDERSEGASAERVPEVVVTATRGERSLLEVPYVVDTVDLGAPLYRGIERTVGEAIGRLPGISDQKTGPAQDSPYVRGLTGYHTLWLIDGIRLNNSVWRAGPNQYSATVDPFLIDRVELVRGPSSALYGSDAIGGTIQLFSADPPDLSDAKLPVGGRVLYRWAGAERSNVGRFEGWWQAPGRVRGRLGVSLKDYGELETAIFGRLPETAYKQGDADAKVVWDATDKLSVTAALQATNIVGAPRTHRTIFAVPYRGTTVGKETKRDLDQRRRLGYVRAEARELGPVDHAQVTLSLQRQWEDRDRVRSDGRRDLSGFDVWTYGAQMQLQGEGPIGRLTGGVEYYRDEVDSRRIDFNADGSFKRKRIQGPVGDEASYDLLGIYLQDEIRLGPAELILGGRYTFAHAVADRVEDPDSGDRIGVNDQWNDFSGNARLVGHLSLGEDAELHPYVGLSQGFRAPNLSDLTRLDTARTNEIEIPSPGLDPERFIALELGSKGAYGPVELSAAWYYTWIRDMIIRRPTGDTIGGDTVVIKENVGDGWITGVELGGRIDLGDWLSGVSVGGGFSWLEGKVDTYPTSAPDKERQWLDRLTPAEGRIDVTWKSEDERFEVGGEVRMVRAQRRLNTRDRSDTSRIPPNGSHGYTLFTVRASGKVGHGLRLFGAVDNITNRAYRVHGSGLNGPGTNAIVGIEWRF